MSDRMTPIPFEKIMQSIFTQWHDENSVFGISNIYRKTGRSHNILFGERLELPIGVAAGPHTQMAQNIISAYLTGARYFELKTVQQLDGADLNIEKPCINARDEGYNVEWSTELTAKQAMEEYIKAYLAIKIICKEWFMGDESGFIFNMSVGYDLKGIKSKKIDDFINGLTDASSTEIWHKCIKIINENKFGCMNVNKSFTKSISPKICNSVTLSTMHGCPTEQIEAIATYLLKEKKLNTYIKCNPTIIGYDAARSIMNDLGYAYIKFDKSYFENDMKANEAVALLTRVDEIAKENKLSFGVKMTNTLPVKNQTKHLPGEEKYMSGRALFPLAIQATKLIANAFEGNLPISFSGGADYKNIYSLYEAGVFPITVCTTLLKPGGYTKMKQLADQFSKLSHKDKIDCAKIKSLAKKSLKTNHYKKHVMPLPSCKLKGESPIKNCFIAPCVSGCPIKQDIPQFLKEMGDRNYNKAFEIIANKNPLPFITGTVCTHNCSLKCTRSFYEESVNIRKSKFFAAVEGYANHMNNLPKKKSSNEIKVAIIGGGTAGLALAHHLTKNGCQADIYEKDELGGIAAYFPEKLLEKSSIEKDIRLALSYGANVIASEAPPLFELLEAYDKVVYASGAPLFEPPSSKFKGAISCAQLIKDLKQNKNNIGAIAIYGDDDKALFAAASVGENLNTSIFVFYESDTHRARFSEEGIAQAIEHNAVLMPQTKPIAFENGIVKAAITAFNGESFEPTDAYININADIFAICKSACEGSELLKYGIESVESSCKTNLKNVYVIGSARTPGCSIVEGIADGIKVLRHITKTNLPSLAVNGNAHVSRARVGIMLKSKDIEFEPFRCLDCSTLCENCVQVCPNRANVAIKCDGVQILHVDALCNECGNCQTFCPYPSSPYKVKFTLFRTREEFDKSINNGFLVLEGGHYALRYKGELFDDWSEDVSPWIAKFIDVIIKKYNYLIY